MRKRVAWFAAGALMACGHAVRLPSRPARPRGGDHDRCGSRSGLALCRACDRSGRGVGQPDSAGRVTRRRDGNGSAFPGRTDSRGAAEASAAGSGWGAVGVGSFRPRGRHGGLSLFGGKPPTCGTVPSGGRRRTRVCDDGSANRGQHGNVSLPRPRMDGQGGGGEDH